MRVKILKPNVPSTFGVPYAVGTIATVPDDYGFSLVRSGLAEDTDNVLGTQPNDPYSRGRVFNTPSQVQGSGGGTGNPFGPAVNYVFAFRASQASRGNLIDQSPNAINLVTNPGIVPTAWAPNAVVPLDAYRSPTSPNGRNYKQQTNPSGTHAATENTPWNTTIGGTTTQGTASYLTQKGAYSTDASGRQLFSSLAAGLAGTNGYYQAPSFGNVGSWNMGTDSMVLRLRQKFNMNTSGQNFLPIFSLRDQSNSAWAGPRILASGGSINNPRVQWRDGVNTAILSDDFATTYANKLFDGTETELVLYYDAPSRMQYCSINNIFPNQSNLANPTTGICPNVMSLGTLTNPAVLSGPITIGGDVNTTTPTEMDFISVDFILLKNSPLPGDLASISSAFWRSSEALLQNSLVFQP